MSTVATRFGQMLVTARGADTITLAFEEFAGRSTASFRRRTRLTADRIQRRAKELAPVDRSPKAPHPGYLRDHIRIRIDRGEDAFEVGWYEEDFSAIGETFYPVYQEFGTSRHAAQPSLFPAAEEVFRTSLDEARNDLLASLSNFRGAR